MQVPVCVPAVVSVSCQFGSPALPVVTNLTTILCVDRLSVRHLLLGCVLSHARNHTHAHAHIQDENNDPPQEQQRSRFSFCGRGDSLWQVMVCGHVLTDTHTRTPFSIPGAANSNNRTLTSFSTVLLISVLHTGFIVVFVLAP